MPRICSYPPTNDTPFWGFSINFPLSDSMLSEVVATSISRPSGRLVDAPALTRNEFGTRVAKPPAIAITLTSLMTSALYKCRNWICSAQLRATMNVLSLSSTAKSDRQPAFGLPEYTGPRPDLPDRCKRPLSCLLGVYELL
jgi:hypothetical protein